MVAHYKSHMYVSRHPVGKTDDPVAMRRGLRIRFAAHDQVLLLFFRPFLTMGPSGYRNFG